MNVNLRRKLDVMRCELCGKPHEARKLQKGWYAEELRRWQVIDIAEAVLCPRCAVKYFGDDVHI